MLCSMQTCFWLKWKWVSLVIQLNLQMNGIHTVSKNGRKPTADVFTCNVDFLWCKEKQDEKSAPPNRESKFQWIERDCEGRPLLKRKSRSGKTRMRSSATGWSSSVSYCIFWIGVCGARLGWSMSSLVKSPVNIAYNFTAFDCYIPHTFQDAYAPLQVMFPNKFSLTIASRSDAVTLQYGSSFSFW